MSRSPTEQKAEESLRTFLIAHEFWNPLSPVPRYDEEENDTEDNDDDEEDDDNDENNDNADDVAHLGQCGSKQHCQDELWDQRRREASTPSTSRELETSNIRGQY